MILETRIESVPEALLTALAQEAPDPADAGAPSQQAIGATSGQYTSKLLVARWLADRGREFRIKPERDGKGRLVYVLKECPFDPSHRDPDACIMQATDGKLSAQCFHNSCSGRGWQDFKEAIGKPEGNHYDPPLLKSGSKRRTPPQSGVNKPETAPPSNGDDETGATASPDGSLPTIQGNKRQLREVTDDALSAIVANNDPPEIFQRGGVLTRVKIRPDDGMPLLEPLVDAALRGVLARAADWTQVKDTKGGQVVEDDAPPLEVVKDLANLPSWDQIPLIEGVIECPTFARNGELVQTRGYHVASRYWYHPADGLQVEPIPDNPTPTEIALARDFLLVELLGDFPFLDDASRAHALAAILLPFVRQLIDGPTPLHLLDAPTEGTGKTLLASAVTLIATGRDAEAIAEADNHEEWRKRITATLLDAPTFILLDNLTRTLDSGALASVLTTRFWKDRVLGLSKTVTLPNNAVWLGSGNNTHLSRELIRRTLLCRLDAKMDTPWLRQGFRHPQLLVWAKANRGKLIAATLTLCQAWLRAGRPAGKVSLGMFESWAAVIGGILEVAGVPGLLANASQFRTQRADQTSEWRSFVVAWWHRFADRQVGVQELFDMATQEKQLDSVLGEKGEKSQRIRLGKALGKATDRVFGDYRIEGAGQDHKDRLQYRLRCTAAQVATLPEEVGQWEA
jgi:putative DNA primase/helicase